MRREKPILGRRFRHSLFPYRRLWLQLAASAYQNLSVARPLWHPVQELPETLVLSLTSVNAWGALSIDGRGEESQKLKQSNQRWEVNSDRHRE